MPKQYIPDADAIGAWRLDANGTDLANISGSAAGPAIESGVADEAVSGMPWTSGKKFVTTESDYMTIADNAILNPTDVLSVGFWFNATSWPGVAGLAYKTWQAGNMGWYIYYNDSSSQLIWVHFSGGGAKGGTTTLAAPISTGAWHHIEASIGNGLQTKLFLDGVRVDSTLTNATAALTTIAWQVVLGAAAGGAGTPNPHGWYFNGLMNDFYMINRQRAAWEIGQTYNAVRNPAGGLRAA